MKHVKKLYTHAVQSPALELDEKEIAWQAFLVFMQHVDPSNAVSSNVESLTRYIFYTNTVQSQALEPAEKEIVWHAFLIFMKRVDPTNAASFDVESLKRYIFSLDEDERTAERPEQTDTTQDSTSTAKISVKEEVGTQEVASASSEGTVCHLY
jgi:hypothetical protein